MNALNIPEFIDQVDSLNSREVVRKVVGVILDYHFEAMRAKEAALVTGTEYGVVVLDLHKKRWAVTDVLEAILGVEALDISDVKLIYRTLETAAKQKPLK